MKQPTTKVCAVLLLGLIMAVGSIFVQAGPAQAQHAFDLASFKTLGASVMAKLIAGNTNVISDLEKMTEIGIAGVKEHQSEAGTPAVEKKLMQIVLDNVGSMKAASLEDIEPQWHDGEVPASNGVDVEQFDHFDEVMTHYDMVIHPITAITAVRAGEIDQAKDEIAEVLEHAEHLK